MMPDRCRPRFLRRRAPWCRAGPAHRHCVPQLHRFPDQLPRSPGYGQSPRSLRRHQGQSHRPGPRGRPSCCTAWPCSLGLASGSYILSGHSCGACLAFQPVLQPPRHYGLGYLPEPPGPAALLGLNGLYDLPALAAADGLGASHAHPRDDYEKFLSRAFGTDKDAWPDASPASFDPAMPSVSWLDFTCL